MKAERKVELVEIESFILTFNKEEMEAVELAMGVLLDDPKCHPIWLKILGQPHLEVREILGMDNEEYESII